MRGTLIYGQRNMYNDGNVMNTNIEIVHIVRRIKKFVLCVNLKYILRFLL